MMMIRCADEHRVNVLAHFIKHLPVVRKKSRLRRIRFLFLQPVLHLGLLLFIRVHNRVKVLVILANHGVQMVHASGAAADLHTIQFVPNCKRARLAVTRKKTGGGNRARSESGALDERTAIQLCCHKIGLLEFKKD